MVKVRSPASATVINAISMGKGSAFGIQLYVTAEVTVLNRDADEEITAICKSLDYPDMDTTLMELCVKRAYDRLKNVPEFDLSNITLKVETISDIPAGSGLSSSSAVSNSIVYATILTLLEEINMKLEDTGITKEEILNMGIDASLDCGVTKTGAYDDASASFYGGWKITDNYERKILYDYLVDYEKILIYIPNKSLYTAQTDVKAMKSLASLVEIAFSNATNKNIEKALTLNGLLYCSALNLDSQIAIDALKLGAKSAGLSGTGSAFTILLDNSSNIDEIKEALSKYPGRLIETKPDNEGSVVIV